MNSLGRNSGGPDLTGKELSWLTLRVLSFYSWVEQWKPCNGLSIGKMSFTRRTRRLPVSQLADFPDKMSWELDLQTRCTHKSLRFFRFESPQASNGNFVPERDYWGKLRSSKKRGLVRTGRKWWEKDWPKAFPEALMKGQKERQFCVFGQEQTGQGQSIWGGTSALNELRFWFIRT